MTQTALLFFPLICYCAASKNKGLQKKGANPSIYGVSCYFAQHRTGWDSAGF